MTKKITLTLAKISFIFLLVILGSVLILPGQIQAATSYASLSLVAKDPQGLVVTDVNYAIYEQLKDANSNPVLGRKLTSGKISDTGYKTVQLKNTAGLTLPIAITYYQLNNEYGKFTLYNQTITGNQAKEISLPFSGVKISIVDPDSNLMKNYGFNVYAVLKNSNGSEIGNKKVLSNQKTSDSGSKTYYLKPGEYFMTVKYVDPTDFENLNSRFTVGENSVANFNYRLGSVRVSITDSTKSNLTGISFKISRLTNDDYVTFGTFKTDSNGSKRVILPSGEYKINSSNYFTDYEFLVVPGNENTLSSSKGSFHFQVIDSLNNPQSNLAVSIYKYQNNAIGAKVYSGATNASGEVIAPLNTGSYLAKIDTAIDGQKFTSRVFFVQQNYISTYQYVISMARIYLTDNQQNKLANQKFYLYNYGTDSQGNLVTNKEIGSYTTNSSGYADANLIGGRYIVKSVSANKVFAINVESEKYNTFYLTVKNTALVNNAPKSTTPTTGNTTKVISTPKTNTVFMASIYTNDNLYNKDTDGDTLSDFEETYIWRTDPKSNDTDKDGYKDAEEIRNGWDPNGPNRKTYTVWAYEKPRVYDLAIEQKEAAYLKEQLIRRIGRFTISDTNMNTLIRAFVYGGYTISEIQNTIQYGPALVHPTIPAYKWRIIRLQK